MDKESLFILWESACLNNIRTVSKQFQSNVFEMNIGAGLIRIFKHERMVFFGKKEKEPFIFHITDVEYEKMLKQYLNGRLLEDVIYNGEEIDNMLKKFDKRKNS